MGTDSRAGKQGPELSRAGGLHFFQRSRNGAGGVLQSVCSWCGTEVADRGICLACAAKLLGDEGMSIQSIIDQFPFPVLVVDDDVKVTVLNKRGQEILGVLPEQGGRRRGGDLFGCVNSHLPGGCGRTIHCSGCALRRAVASTYRSRKPLDHVPATLKRGEPDDPSAVALTFSTAMRGDAVLVKIDNIDFR